VQLLDQLARLGLAALQPVDRLAQLVEAAAEVGGRRAQRVHVAALEGLAPVELVESAAQRRELGRDDCRRLRVGRARRAARDLGPPAAAVRRPGRSRHTR
jgi:hypothetical protein